MIRVRALIALGSIGFVAACSNVWGFDDLQKAADGGGSASDDAAASGDGGDDASAGGDAATGDGGGSDSTGGACKLQYFVCPTSCQECADTNCCDQEKACANDSLCTSYFQCANTCLSNAGCNNVAAGNACVMNCGSLESMGSAAANLFNCMQIPACASNCN